MNFRAMKYVAAGVMGVMTMMHSAVFAEGTETLGPAQIVLAEGSGFALGGVGLFQDNGGGSYTNLDGDIDVEVPAGATVEQVLLYWVGETGPTHDANPSGDDSCFADGNPVTGTLIGGATRFFGLGDGSGGIWYETYRADITGLGLIAAGNNTVAITGLDFTYRNTGAGIIVIYDDGSTAEIEILDGLDLAYHKLTGDLEVAQPQTLLFDPVGVDRVANVPLFVASVGEDRPNVTEITSGGVTTQFFDLFTSADGPQWDSVLLPITIPANADSVTIEILSADGGGSGNNPASFAWALGGVAIEDPDEDCGDCDGKVTELTLEYQGAQGAQVTIKHKGQGNSIVTVFDKFLNPGDVFTIVGQDNKGTLGPEVKIWIDGELSTCIHTSCSQPIGPGLVRGDFEVVDGYSRNGGRLCTPVEANAQHECEPKDFNNGPNNNQLQGNGKVK